MKIFKDLRAVILSTACLVGCTLNLHAQANLTLSSPNTSGTYSASNSITLANGFTTAPGQTLHAFINPLAVNCVPLASTPSAGQNYIATHTLRVDGITNPSTIPLLDVCQVMQTIKYMDGLGRLLQTVQTKGGANADKDVVIPNAYDVFGREGTKYLPYAATGTSGSLRTTAFADQATYYSPATSIPGVVRTLQPYSQIFAEFSPLNRPLETGAPGTDWQPGNGHTVKTITTLNDNVAFNAGNTLGSRQVVFYAASVNTDGSRTLTNSSTYADGELTVTITKDENWTPTLGCIGTTETYTDKENHVILKRIYNSITSGVQMLSTYYVYDDFGDLAFVLPPKAEPDAGLTSSANQPILDNLGYQYQYDELGRVTKKKLPGKGWEYTVYNVLDQPVATQDANQRANNQWIITKYDGQGRVAITGIWNNGNTTITPESLKTLVYAQTTKWETKDNTQIYGYTLTNTYPTSLNTILSVNYYDDYNITGLPYDHHTENSQMVTGLLTASKVNILGTNDMLWTVNYYDDKGRMAHVYTQHYLGGTASLNTANYDHIVNTYDFTNAITNTTRTHYTTVGGTTPAVTIANTYVYDHMGRKRQSFEQINNGINTLISQNDFNDIGQEYIKHLHSTDNGTTFLQAATYNYNERGWLTSSTTDGNLFNLSLNYNNSGTGIIQQWNGNISTMVYNVHNPSSATHQFTYTYDALNRLTIATSTGNNLNEAITYDKMGNITALIRGGSGAANLSYTYANSDQSNQLVTVSNTLGAGLSYGYDPNGNATTDGKISNTKTFIYNILNLPSNLSQGGATIANYIYDGTGTKRRTTSTADGTWDYINGIIYHNNTISFISTEEGRAIPNGGTYKYQYNLKDHLGNVRVSMDANGVLQEDEYYAFGLRNGLFDSSNDNRYLYNGKEILKDLDKQYDYGARFYDPVIARWGHIDPKAELYFNWSPYNYALNTPTNAIDPNGHLVIFIAGQNSGNGASHQYWSDKNGAFDWEVQWHFNDLKPAKYYDGADGGWLNTATSLFDQFATGGLNGHGNLFSSDRYEAGKKQGGIDAEAIITSLNKSGGVITESLKIVSHSMGGAYAKGFIHAIVQWAINHPDQSNGLKISEFDFDPLQGAELRAIEGVHTEQYTHNAKKHGVHDPMNRIADGKQQGLNNDQGKKDRNSYTEDPLKTDHSIMTFINNINQLEEGTYVFQDGEWVKQ
ncbi:MAG: hypothetical protein JWQ34_3164 [Mucilaginibacter sp.]|uniref:DUF6443 domain-containing protein n=1 Tax=Mucilaginibacter sp. TaxID=1882438 RepID=UPI0026274C0F|nr:DUF6443 domain-containing protein [Mucilaginibacter sp.]MDB5004939.1 hypothetical protein [Mucilaginibacter sp.]